MTYRWKYLKNIVDKKMDEHMCSTQRIWSKSLLAIEPIYYVVSIWFLFTTDDFFFGSRVNDSSGIIRDDFMFNLRTYEMVPIIQNK